MPAAASSAAVLGSRNARRQLRSVLAVAAETGAYSVGFCSARGELTGFTVYFAGDFAGASKRPGTAATCAVPRSSRLASTDASAQPTARAPAASTAPAPPAAVRRRGCRAGAKVQQRRRSVSARLPPTAAVAAADVPLEGGTDAARPCGKAHVNMTVSAAPSAPPLHNSHSLSPLAPAFSPSSPPRPPSSPSLSDRGEEDPLSHPPDLRHLLPHARLSYEEQRWEHYISYGGPFPPHGSSKKRRDPPSPALSSPSSSIVGCVVNERRPRAAPPPPPTPRLPPARER